MRKLFYTNLRIGWDLGRGVPAPYQGASGAIRYGHIGGLGTIAQFCTVWGRNLAKLHHFCDSGAARTILKMHDPSTKLPQRVEVVSDTQNSDFRHIWASNREFEVKFGLRQGKWGVLGGQ